MISDKIKKLNQIRIRNGTRLKIRKSKSNLIILTFQVNKNGENRQIIDSKTMPKLFGEIVLNLCKLRNGMTNLNKLIEKDLHFWGKKNLIHFLKKTKTED